MLGTPPGTSAHRFIPQMLCLAGATIIEPAKISTIAAPARTRRASYTGTWPRRDRLWSPEAPGPQNLLVYSLIEAESQERGKDRKPFNTRDLNTKVFNCEMLTRVNCRGPSLYITKAGMALLSYNKASEHILLLMIPSYCTLSTGTFPSSACTLASHFKPLPQEVGTHVLGEVKPCDLAHIQHFQRRAQAQDSSPDLSDP